MQTVLDQIENISPWDEIEESHLKDCMADPSAQEMLLVEQS
jgi:hypothetical protein